MFVSVTFSSQILVEAFKSTSSSVEKKVGRTSTMLSLFLIYDQCDWTSAIISKSQATDMNFELDSDA